MSWRNVKNIAQRSRKLKIRKEWLIDLEDRMRNCDVNLIILL